MANQLALDIVQTALALRGTHPKAPALDILDLAMEGRSGTDPVFDGSDDSRIDSTGLTASELEINQVAVDLVHPDGAFGKLLAEALLPPGRVIDRDTHEWHLEVMLPFAQRYGLWSKRANLPPSTWRTRCFHALWNLTVPARLLRSAQDDDEEELEDDEMDAHDQIEGLAMQAAEIYEDPASDGLTPEAAVAMMRRSQELPLQ